MCVLTRFACLVDYYFVISNLARKKKVFKIVLFTLLRETNRRGVGIIKYITYYQPRIL